MLLTFIDSFLNIFISGRSELKVTLFFLYLLLLIILYLILKKKPIKNYPWKYFGFGLIAMYLYNLTLQLFYLIHNHTGLNDYLITGHNGEISSSSIIHSHIAKGTIGQIFSFFGQTNLANLDAGGAYVGLIPGWLFLLGFLIMIGLVFAAGFYFATSFRLILTNKNRRQKIFLILGYALLSFSLIETSIDGGLLSRSFLAGTALIYLFVFREKNRKQPYAYLLLLIISSLLLVPGFLNFPLSVTKLINLYAFSALLSFYGLIFYLSDKKINWLAVYLLTIVFIPGWYLSSQRNRNLYNYSNTYLPAGKTAYVYNNSENKIEKLIIEKGQTIRQLSAQLGKNLNYNPIAVNGLTCNENEAAVKIGFDLISLKSLSGQHLDDFYGVVIKKEDSIPLGDAFKTSLIFYLSPCTPDFYAVIDGALRHNNINYYLLRLSIF